jgi:phosphomannomutase/phosphoglucomutase
MSLGKLISLLCVVAALLSALAGGTLYWAAREALEAQRQEATRLAAESTARQLALLMTQLGQSLDGLAADERVANALASGDPARIEAEQARLGQGLPGALLVRLTHQNLSTPDESQAPRMGFADLDMLRRAAQAAPPPAVHGANTPDVHLALARKLGAGDGVLLVSLSTGVLQDALASAQTTAALELRQETLPLAFQGDASLKGVPAAGEIPVPGTRWKIAYWYPGDGELSLLWFILPFVLVAASLTALVYFIKPWLHRIYVDDANSVGLLIVDLLHGKLLGNYPLRIADNAEFVRRITELRRAEKEASGAPAAAPESQIARDKSAGNVFLSPDTVRSKEQIRVETTLQVPASIFRAYDIRGVVGETLTPEIVHAIGRAVGSEAQARGEQRVIVARDGRLSSPDLAKALAEGLKASGRTVIDIGLAPTPLLYYATHVLNGKSGVMVTGSHNPANYNGLKIVIAGETLAEQDIQKLRQRIEQGDFVHGTGKIETRDLIPDYIERVVQDMQIARPLKVVMDCGNGVAGKVAPMLLKELDCELVELYCDVDGRFPNHHPDPSKPENLKELVDTVLREKADLGLAFDGDGDRLGVVDSAGKIIWPDRQMMVFAADVLCRQPGADIIFDVKCTRHLPRQIVKAGGRPLMWKTGHSLIKAKMRETGAQLAGEMSGHIFFKERWYGFDDGIYAAARLVEILSGDPRDTTEVFAELPDSVNTPELNVTLEEGENFRFIERLKGIAEFPEARVTDIDGLRVDFMDGFGLVRASNTTPALVIRFEADNEAALARIQAQFRELLSRVKAGMSLPF